MSTICHLQTLSEMVRQSIKLFFSGHLIAYFVALHVFSRKGYSAYYKTQCGRCLCVCVCSHLQEVTKLRALASKQKRELEQLRPSQGPSFDPSKAFKHDHKENQR